MSSDYFRMLCSYAYFRASDMAKLARQVGEISDRPVMTFGDSGAHSAKTLGLSLTIPEYAAWCRKWDDVLTLYANLDVIGAPKGTWDNQKRLEQEYGLQPIPVFHTGEDWKWLERYLEEGYTYIALGALLGNPLPRVMPWLAKAFRIAGDQAVFHGFGMTTWPCVTRFPFYSVDSSTWSSGPRFGRALVFHQGKFNNVHLRDKPAVLKWRKVIRDEYGVDPVVLASHHTYDRNTLTGLCAASWHQVGQHLRNLHGPIELPPGPHDPVRRRPGMRAPTGLHLYLADSQGAHMRHGAAGIRKATAARKAS